ncbi:MAG: hypothetical protein Q4E32_03990 [Bacteroidales bacterium]|nr:hypothetical protein [Bacteroidales bacterium]
MMKQKILLFSMLLSATSLFAQTDFTSRITNPSFENNGSEGWVHQGMSPQGNDVFTLKAGSTYMEKWTGRGGQVGSCKLSQKVTGLAPGNYVLTVAAQNIQEDTPTAAQSGAWIFADEAKTTVTVCDNYTVEFNYVHGYVNIGFEAVNATGNYICVDNFRLTKVGEDLLAEVNAAITSGNNLYGNGSGKEAQQLHEAIVAAQSLSMSATAQEQADAIIAIENAIGIYKRANASPSNPYVLTSLIENPSFETGDLEGWTSQNMAIQGNSAFGLKSGTYYVEKWTGRGGKVGDALIQQTITDMAPGRYRLRAASQNIQENTPSTAQSGAWLFANTSQQAVTTGQDYVFDFVLTSDQLTLGFKAEGATGNYLCIDNFRLEYIGDSDADVRAAFAQLIQQAEALVSSRMYILTQQKLQQAIDIAKPLQADGPLDELAVASRKLEAAYAEAQTSVAAFAKLDAAITTAQNEVNSSSASEKAEYQAAIDAARDVYNNTETTDAQALAAIPVLEAAAFAFKIANGTGTAPTVTTDPRFIKGSRWAFGRSTVTGSNIIETGFCWSENPDPKVTDNRTTEFLNQAGKIYWLRDLNPATMYYMRAYAITNTYAVGYGDVIKFSTVPAASIGHWYNNGGDEATNDRINNAINRSMDYYWGNTTSIHDFGISVTYSPGTPTADCSYGGSMRVGANTSYQRPGTIMHEALHGIGVGTHGMWWSSDMRSNGDRGDWLGDRVTEAVRFWDNNTTGVITGDNTHLWPYGCNGANEDNGSDNLYVMMGIIAQALNEDGLPAPGTNYALPYYSFTHEDGVKYYIKNEDEAHGLKTAYLVETSDHKLKWEVMTAEEATENDAAAWYITFKPNNQYYQLRNANSGYYLTYASSTMKTVKHSTPTSTDDFHLMRGRVDVQLTKNTPAYRGYYIIHPTNSSNPPVLAAQSNGSVTTSSFNIAYGATTQRWVILTAEELQGIDSEILNAAKKSLEDIIASLRQMLETPHKELAEGTDETLNTVISTCEAEGQTSKSLKEINNLIDQLRAAGKAFLSTAYATEEGNPFDITCLLENPNFKEDAITGWTADKEPTYSNGIAEYYEKTFDFNQTLTDMPKGNYEMRVQAFQRPGELTAVYTDFKNGTDNAVAQIYLATTAQTVLNICAETNRTSLNTDDYKLANRKFVPTTMAGAAAHFNKNHYDNIITRTQTDSGNMKLGIKCTTSATAYWTAFDNFRLYYYGDDELATGIKDIMEANSEQWQEQSTIYDLSGRRIDATSGLRKGIYIINGKKVYVK